MCRKLIHCEHNHCEWLKVSRTLRFKGDWERQGTQRLASWGPPGGGGRHALHNTPLLLHRVSRAVASQLSSAAAPAGGSRWRQRRGDLKVWRQPSGPVPAVRCPPAASQRLAPCPPLWPAVASQSFMPYPSTVPRSRKDFVSRNLTSCTVAHCIASAHNIHIMAAAMRPQLTRQLARRPCAGRSPPAAAPCRRHDRWPAQRTGQAQGGTHEGGSGAGGGGWPRVGGSSDPASSSQQHPRRAPAQWPPSWCWPLGGRAGPAAAGRQEGQGGEGRAGQAAQSAATSSGGLTPLPRLCHHPAARRQRCCPPWPCRRQT